MKIENSVFLRPAKDPDPKSSPNGSRLKSPWVVVEVVVFEVPTAESTGREEIERLELKLSAFRGLSKEFVIVP